MILYMTLQRLMGRMSCRDEGLSILGINVMMVLLKDLSKNSEFQKPITAEQTSSFTVTQFF